MKRKIKKRRRQLKKWISIFFIACVTVAIVHIFPIFKVKAIQVNGNGKFTPQDIVLMSGVHIGDNMFGLDKKQVQDQLMHNEVIESCKVEKKFPHQINLTIVENTPMAYFYHNGNTVIIYSKGNVKTYASNISTKNLIEVEGLNADKIDETINVYDDKNVEKIFQHLKDVEYFSKIKSVNVSNLQNIEIMLDGDVRLCLGKVDQITDNIASSEEILKSVYSKNINIKELNFTVSSDPVIKKYVENTSEN